MRFTFNGGEYSISFKRETKDITRFNGEIVQSRFPVTTVTLASKVISDGTISSAWLKIREASVIAAKGDSFTHEKGRLAALRSISCTLDKDFKKALWKSYTSRPRG